MAHRWEDVPAKRPLDAPERRCARCGASQTWAQDQLWMRVVRSYWTPNVGRCPTDKKPGRPDVAT